MSPLQLFSAVGLLIILTSSSVKGAPIYGQQEANIPDYSKIYFQLFTRKNPTEFQTLKLNDLDALEKSNYNPNTNVKIYFQGWGLTEYLLREDINVLLIDWRGVQNPNYTDAVNITLKTGLHAAAFIDFLIDNGTPRSSFHLIGHSVGCHLAGIAGSAVTSGKLPRVTGLDPARIGYVPTDIDPSDLLLNKDDADFVDILHTGGGTDPDDRGIFDPIGHVDFYANGGQHQPGCNDGSCSHLRATDLFAESINTKVGFRALRCDNYEDFQKGLCDGNKSELMGDLTPFNTRGIFHFDTNGESPFARG